MTLYEFNALSFDNQLACAWDNGSFLMTRRAGLSYLCLYAIETFFVEIRYSQDLNHITACRAFRSTITLESYLKEIHLTLERSNN